MGAGGIGHGWKHGARAGCSIDLEDMSDKAKALRLMIVDDSPGTRRALSACVAGQGGLKVVCEAVDGQDAIEKIETRLPDVVLMDCRMPRMTGLEATRILKRRWPEIKVVILTMYSDCQLESRSAGADAVLIKGCSLDELAATLRSVTAG